MDKKFGKLKNILRDLRKVVIAYSGGLDSTFLLKTAVDTLGREDVLAVTARSETYPVSEYREAVNIAKSIGARHVTIKTEELKIKNFKSNPVNRCYYCKRELFKRLGGIRDKYKMKAVLDGTNFDDLKDVRHGMKAGRELGVRSPLLEARIGKEDIRRLSKRLKLPTWDKPSFACLASRFPFNSEITKEGLQAVGRAEAYLREAGLRQVRVRAHGNIARLETYKEDFGKMLNKNKIDAIVKKLKALGFKYIALDMEGYRTGSMH